MKRSRFYIYTDASMRDGISAWAFVSVTPGLAPKQFVYHTAKSGLIPAKLVRENTEVAELYAISQAISWVSPVSNVHIFTDSEPVAQLMTKLRHPLTHTNEDTLYQTLTQLIEQKRIMLTLRKIRRASNVFSEYVNMLCRARAASEQITPFWLFELGYSHRHIDWAEQPAK